MHSQDELTISRIRQAVIYAKKHSAFYRHLLRFINPEHIHDITDFRTLPFVSKSDLTTHPTEFWCIQREKIIDYCSTSGSAGHAMTIPLASEDLERLALNEAGSFATAGVTKKDTIQLCTTIDRRFMAGLAYTLGAHRLGASLVRTGPGLAEYQWKTMFEIQSTVLVIVPSFLVRLLHFAKENGIEPEKTTVRKVICIGESIRNPDFSLNALGSKIKDSWNVGLYSTYASSEMQTAFTECSHMNGGHFNTELIFPEIIDESGAPVSPGKEGELVITTLGVTGMPLVRYKTGDITSIHIEECECGNPSYRIGPVRGRKNQMIKIKGTSCYPPALIEILNGLPEVENFQIQVSRDELGNDQACVFYHSQIEISSEKLRDYFRSRLRFAPDFNWVSESVIQRMVYSEKSRKPIVFLDQRHE